MEYTSDPKRKKESVPSSVVSLMLNSLMRMKVTLWVHKVWETIEPVLREIIEEAKLVKKFLKGFPRNKYIHIGRLKAYVERRRNRKVRGKRKSRKTSRRRKCCRNDDGSRVVAHIRNQNRSRTILRIQRRVRMKMSEGGRGRKGREGRERREGKRRKREIEKKRKKEKKGVDGDKKRKRKEKEKKSEKGKKGAATNYSGKYGIIRETDMWNKRLEFIAWLLEIRKVNLESLPPWEEKKIFKDFMEADMLMMHKLVYLNERNVELNKLEAYLDGERVENKQVENEHVPVSEQKADMRDLIGVQDSVKFDFKLKGEIVGVSLKEA